MNYLYFFFFTVCGIAFCSIFCLHKTFFWRLEVDDGWLPMSDSPEDCWTSVTAQMEHSKCNDVCVNLGVSGGHMLMCVMCITACVSLFQDGVCSRCFFPLAVSTYTCWKSKITDVCEYYWPCFNLDLLLVCQTPHSCSISQPVKAPCAAKGNIQLLICLDVSPPLLHPPAYMFLINHVCILSRSHVKTDKQWNIKLCTLLLQRQSNLEELSYLTRKTF